MKQFWKNPLLGFTILLALQWLGEFLVQWLHLPVPGSVVGMALLFVSLWLWGSTPTALADISRILLTYLSLLFVPAATGALLRMEAFRTYLWAFAIIAILSTLVTLGVSAWAMQFMNSRKLP